MLLEQQQVQYQQAMAERDQYILSLQSQLALAQQKQHHDEAMAAASYGKQGNVSVPVTDAQIPAAVGHQPVVAGGVEMTQQYAGMQPAAPGGWWPGVAPGMPVVAPVQEVYQQADG